MTNADQEQLLLVIESRANTGGLDAAEKKVVATAQSVAAANASMGASAANAGRESAAAINEDIRLLALKARAADVTNTTMLAELRANIAAEKEHLQAVRATEEQFVRLSLVSSGLEKRTRAVSTSIGGLKAGRETIHSAAGAMTTLAYAAESASLGGKSAAMAMGNVAQSLALVGTNAQFAMWASGIGAFVTVATAAVAIFEKMNEEAQASDAVMHRMSAYGLEASKAQLAALDARIADLNTKLAASDPTQGTHHDRTRAAIAQAQMIEGLKQLQAQRQQYADQVIKQQADQDRAEAKSVEQRAKELAKRAAEERKQQMASLLGIEARVAKEEDLRAAGSNAFAQKRAAEEIAYKEELDALEALDKVSKEIREADAQRIRENHKLRMRAIDEEARIADIKYRHQNDATEANGDPQAEYDAKVQLIRDVEEADKRAGVDKVEAHRRAELAIQKLEDDRVKAGLRGYAALSAAAQGHSRILEIAARAGAAAVKLHELPALAHIARVNALKEWAASTADFASGNIPGGVGHALASGGYWAAVAAAAVDAGGSVAGIGGSGGGGGGGGGGGMGSFGQSTFTPNSDKNAGNLTLNIITRDPYGKDSIAQTVFELQRSGDLKRTVPIGPTSGFTFAGST